jgi:hypothetical protein
MKLNIEKIKSNLAYLFQDFKDWVFDLKHSCELGRGFFYRVYQALAGNLDCYCCLFWRGAILAWLLVIAIYLSYIVIF